MTVALSGVTIVPFHTGCQNTRPSKPSVGASCAPRISGWGVDNEKVNIVFNNDMPENSDLYLYRVSVLYCLGMYKQDGQDTMRHDTRGTIITSCPCYSHQSCGQQRALKSNCLTIPSVLCLTAMVRGTNNIFPSFCLCNTASYTCPPVLYVCCCT